MKKDLNRRILELIPGSLSWLVLFSIFGLYFYKPVIAAIVLIIFLIFWICRLLYMSSLMFLAHHRMLANRDIDWLKLCEGVNSDKKLEDIVHVVLYTVYKEPVSVLEYSLNSLDKIKFPKGKIILVLAGEGRAQGSLEKLDSLRKKFGGAYKNAFVTIHPAGIEGEIPCKGANATFAAKKVKEFLEKEKYDLGNIVISIFDADTCMEENYLSCLTYHFLNNPKRYQTSFQPLPIYNNNIFKVPAFARAMEMGSTFWQLIESMRYEKFVTFSSHSMSFKTLVDIDYWPVDLVSDDSLIYWKCFLKFNGDYTTYALEIPVYMDIAVGKNFFDTICVQYKQKRRWAWGVETFVFLGMGCIRNENISLVVKTKKLLQILDSHINWATWSIIISFITPLILFWAKMAHQDSLVFLNLSYINSVIFNSLSLILVLCIFISKEFIPPLPKGVSRFVYVSFMLQWLLIPVFSAFLGSLPALDAQTRLMFKKQLKFFVTPKNREGL